MESVDYCPMGIIIYRHSGESLCSQPSFDVDCGRYPPLEGPISHSGMALSRLTPCAVDSPLGNSVGAIGWLVGPVVALLRDPTR
jgi:hypothetical protein